MFGPEHAEEQYKALENHKACEAGTKNIKGSEYLYSVGCINTIAINIRKKYSIIQIIVYVLNSSLTCFMIF